MKVDFSTLMMWAGKWSLAANVLSEIISDWDPIKEKTLSLGFDLFTLLGCYENNQQKDKTRSFLQNCINKMKQTSNLYPLAEYFEFKRDNIKDNQIKYVPELNYFYRTLY